MENLLTVLGVTLSYIAFENQGQSGPYATMLELDVKNLPGDKVAAVLAERCAKFGSVLHVQVLGEPRPRALIEMATGIQAIRVREALGGTLSGTMVTLSLEPRPAEVHIPPEPGEAQTRAPQGL